MLDEIFAGEHRNLQRARELVGARAPIGVGIEQARRVKAFPVKAHAVAVHHLRDQAFERDRRPDGAPSRCIGIETCSTIAPAPRRRSAASRTLASTSGSLDWPAEALGHHADAHAGHAAAEPGRVAVLLDLHVILARIESVGAGDHFQQQGVVGDGCRHRSGMVDGRLDRHHAGIGHQTVRRPSCRSSRNRTQACGSSRPGRRRSPSRPRRRRPARRSPTTSRRPSSRTCRVVHRTQRRGVAAAGQAKIFAMRLADDRAAGIENAGDDRRIDIRHVAFERRGAVHHRHAGEADIVLQDDALAGQRSVRGAAHFGLHRPGIERILVGARADSRACADSAPAADSRAAD